MTISSQIIADSLNPLTGDRLTSFMLTYPRFIHSELMTHRVLSRNASSSRAIPIEKMIAMIEENPAEPVEWGTNQKGMQAGNPLEGHERALARAAWHFGLGKSVTTAHTLLERGVHKQIANRVLEPWAHMTTLVTATELGNFFKLRAHPDAQPEFQELAYEMLDSYLNHEPKILNIGEWHLPFDMHDDKLDINTKIKVCVARCARTSYIAFDGSYSVEADVAMHDRLLNNGHMSPFEHIGTPNYGERTNTGNFRGFTQYRQIVEPMHRHGRPTREELEQILAQRPVRA